MIYSVHANEGCGTDHLPVASGITKIQDAYIPYMKLFEKLAVCLDSEPGDDLEGSITLMKGQKLTPVALHRTDEGQEGRWHRVCWMPKLKANYRRLAFWAFLELYRIPHD
jgi:hypothetical protein